MNGTERAPIGNDLYGAFGRDFATKDGRRVMVAATTSRQWKSLLDAIDGHEAMGHVEAMLGVDLSDEGQRFEARDVIAPVVARSVGARGYDEVRAAFDAGGVCWGGLTSRFWRRCVTTRAARRGIRCSRRSSSRGWAAS